MSFGTEPFSLACVGPTYRPLTSLNIGSATTTFEYDNNTGRRTKTTSPEGKITEYAYNTAGNIMSVTQYLNPDSTPTPVITTYEYNQNNYGPNLVKVVDAEGYQTTYEYDSEYRLSKEVLWDVAATATPVQWATYEYSDDGMSRLVKKFDFKGQSTEYEYDDIGRVEKVTYYNAEATPTPVLWLEYTYDLNGYGTVTQISSSCCDTETFTYDQDLNYLLRRDSVDHLGDIEYDYDAAGRMTILEYPIEWNTQPTPAVTDTFAREKLLFFLPLDGGG